MDPLDKASDAELVRRIQRGAVNGSEGQAATGVLYDRYHERIFRYLWLRVGDRHQAEDLTGEVFTRMVASLPGYQNMDLPFTAWLYRIAHNLLVDQYRKQSLLQWVKLDDADRFVMEKHDPSRDIDEHLAFEEVRRALEKIDPQQREVIILRFLVGLPIKDVASILGKNIPNIKALQFRGLQRLRMILETA